MWKPAAPPFGPSLYLFIDKQWLINWKFPLFLFFPFFLSFCPFLTLQHFFSPCPLASPWPPQNGVVHPRSGLWDYSKKTDPQTERAQPEMCGPGGVRTHHPHQEKCQQGNQERLEKRRSQKNSPFLHFHLLPPSQLSTFISQPRPLHHTHVSGMCPRVSSEVQFHNESYIFISHVNPKKTIQIVWKNWLFPSWVSFRAPVPVLVSGTSPPFTLCCLSRASVTLNHWL